MGGSCSAWKITIGADAGRSTRLQFLEDLEWLGLEPDIGQPAEFRSGASPFRQSDNRAAYDMALQQLSAGFQVYACECSRKDIVGDSDTPDQETRYPGGCRTRGLPLQKGRGIRVAIDPGGEQFLDGVLGEQLQDPSEQCGDLLVKVARMLGRDEPPSFAHHPLIRHRSGAKLSKANRDTGIRELRAAGVTPAAVLGQAAYLTGLMKAPRNLPARELAALFDRS